MGHQLPVAAAQLHRAATHPLRASGVRVALPPVIERMQRESHIGRTHRPADADAARSTRTSVHNSSGPAANQLAASACSLLQPRDDLERKGNEECAAHAAMRTTGEACRGDHRGDRHRRGARDPHRPVFLISTCTVVAISGTVPAARPPDPPATTSWEGSPANFASFGCTHHCHAPNAQHFHGWDSTSARDDVRSH